MDKEEKIKKSISYAVSVSVYWECDWKTVFITKINWEKIKAGKSFSKRGQSYTYEEGNYSTYFCFSGGLDGDLFVEYGDGGVGYSGPLNDPENVKIREFK